MYLKRVRGSAMYISSQELIAFVVGGVVFLSLFIASQSFWPLRGWFWKFSKRSRFLSGEELRIREFVMEAVAENERHYGIYLSRAGREMLIPPIEEAFENGPFDFGTARESISIVFRSMTDHPYPMERPYFKLHNAKSVIQAFHERFCQIPPFCDGRSE
jgi:hypothetical protein